MVLRFPEPICSKMKYLVSNDPSAADVLAERAQAVHARLAGRGRTAAQIDYLTFLQTWCPFFGSTFYRVQCQYDRNPLDSSASSNPPVVDMTAAVGPAAIHLLTSSESTLLRHPYQRIIKWIAHADKHIFTYWVIKPEVRLSDIEQYQGAAAGGQFDPRPYCDCVYLVTPQVRELEHLVKSYVQSAAGGAAPSLPGAPEELRAPEDPDYEELYNQLKETTQPETGKKVGGTKGSSGAASASSSSGRRPSSSPAKVSRLSVFLSALGGNATAAAEEEEEVVSGSGMALYSEADEQQQGQEVGGGGGLSTLFKNMYVTAQPAKNHHKRSNKRGEAEDDEEQEEDGDASLLRIPTSVRYASTLAELQKVANEEQFSDSEEDDEPSSEEEEEDERESERGADNGEEEEEGEGGAAAAQGHKKAVRRDSAIARASRAFFKVVTGAAGGGKGKGIKSTSDSDNDDEPDDEEEEGEQD